MGQILESIKLSTPLMMDFIQFGGLDFIEKAIRVHEKDDYIAMMLPKLQKVILGKLLPLIYIPHT